MLPCCSRIFCPGLWPPGRSVSASFPACASRVLSLQLPSGGRARAGGARSRRAPARGRVNTRREGRGLGRGAPGPAARAGQRVLGAGAGSPRGPGRPARPRDVARLPGISPSSPRIPSSLPSSRALLGAAAGISGSQLAGWLRGPCLLLPALSPPSLSDPLSFPPAPSPPLVPSLCLSDLDLVPPPLFSFSPASLPLSSVSFFCFPCLPFSFCLCFAPSPSRFLSPLPPSGFPPPALPPPLLPSPSAPRSPAACSSPVSLADPAPPPPAPAAGPARPAPPGAPSWVPRPPGSQGHPPPSRLAAPPGRPPPSAPERRGCESCSPRPEQQPLARGARAQRSAAAGARWVARAGCALLP